MANNQGELHNHPVQHIGNADVLAGHRGYRLLDVARLLLLLGAVAAISTVGNPNADVAQVFFGFLAWTLGVCLLPLVAVAAGRFPQADALADAALKHLIAPWN